MRNKKTIELHYKGELIDSRIMQHSGKPHYEKMWIKRYGQKMKNSHYIEIRIVDNEAPKPVAPFTRTVARYPNREYL